MNGSKLLEGFIPDVDATVVSRILDAGGRIVGKAVCEDLCSDGGSFTSVTGPVTNPHNKDRMAGGSSSGSAALVRRIVVTSLSLLTVLVTVLICKQCSQLFLLMSLKRTCKCRSTSHPLRFYIQINTGGRSVVPLPLPAIVLFP